MDALEELRRTLGVGQMPREVVTLEEVWQRIQAQMAGTAFEVPDAIFNITSGWASGDTAATAVDWLAPRRIVRVNLGNHADAKALLVELLHLAAHAVSTRGEVEQRERRREVARDIAARPGQSASQVAHDLRISDGTVYRHRAWINEGRTPEDAALRGDEEVSRVSATGGTYHSRHFRAAAQALGLRVSKIRIPGRGFEIVAGSPLAPSSVRRYRPEIADLRKIIPLRQDAAKTKPGPVYLACECQDPPRQIRMANGPGRLASQKQDIVCQICGHSFALIEGSRTRPGFQGAGPGRPRRS